MIDTIEPILVVVGAVFTGYWLGYGLARITGWLS